MVLRKLKEKCKDAARMRREKERSEFVELSKLLPLPSSTTSQLDKASIIRLTSSYLRMRAAFPEGLGANWGTRKLTSSPSSSNCNARVASCSPSSAANDVAFCQQSSAIDSQSGLFRQQTSLNKQTLRNLIIKQPDQQQQLQHRQLQKQQQTQIKELGFLILQTLDGFVFALHRDGKIMYISETASVLLGLPQIDLTGSSVFDYVHPADHNDLLDMLSLNNADRQDIQAQSNAAGHTDTEHLELGRSFSMRLKCILPKRNAGLTQNGYKSIHCTGYLKVKRNRRQHQQPSRTQLNSTSSDKSVGDHCHSHGRDTTLNLPFTQGEDNNQVDDSDWDSYALVAVGHSLLPSASTEVKLSTNSFMFRANLDMKIYYMEASAVNSLGHQQNNLVGQSLYQLVHLADLKQLEEAHRSLLSKSQVVSKYFRLMRREGGYVWVQMQATLINNTRSMPKPLHIVGICMIIGDNHDDRSSLLLDEPSNLIQNESGKLLESQADQSGQRRRFTKSHSVACSSLTIKDGTNKSILATHKRAAAKRRERSSLPSKRIRQSVEGNSNDKFKVIDDNHHETNVLLAPVINQTSIRSRSSLRIDRSFDQTIGPVRRFSDDTCSVTSSMTSASTTSAAIIPSGGQIVVSCPPSSVSSRSSSSSICSPSSLSLPRSSSAMRSSNHCLPSKFHQTQPTIPEAFAQMDLGQREQQQQCCAPTAIVNSAELGHIYIDHGQYQSTNYWPSENERFTANINDNRSNEAVQFKAKQLQYTLPDQYYYHVDEQHLDTNNQSMHYYHYSGDESTFYNGPPGTNLQMAETKCGMDNTVSEQLIHYQYPYPITNQIARESMSVTSMTPAVLPCFAAAHQSF